MISDVIILGGGWAGINFATELKRNFPKLNITVLEKSSTPGGLLKSEINGGHTFDIGGSHIIFSRNKFILSRILSKLNGNFVKHARKTYVLLNSMFVPYPLENGLYVLPPEERAEALVYFLEAWFSRENNWTPKNFRDWIYGFFGKWIAEKYLVPYNLKMWKRPLESIGVDWVYTPGRLPFPDWRSIVKSAIGFPTIGYIEQNSFYYPKYGGIQSLFNSSVKEAKNLGVRIISSVKVSELKIQPNNGFIINGNIKAKKIINTIPLIELTKILEAQSDVTRASNKLDHNRVLVVGVALKKKAPNQHWVYVPNKEIIFHRYAWISNYSLKNAPKNESTLIAETTLIPNTKINIDELTNKVIKNLEDLNVLSEREILFTKAWVHEYGYPIHKIDSRENRERILQWLKEKNIVSAGRWGGWRYLNTDKIYEEILTIIKRF